MFLITAINSSDETYDADVKYFILEINEDNLMRLRLFKDAISDVKKLGAKSICFDGLGYFLQTKVDDQTFFEEISEVSDDGRIAISNNNALYTYIKMFGVVADVTCVFEDELVFRFYPPHFAGSIESELIPYSIFTELVLKSLHEADKNNY